MHYLRVTDYFCNESGEMLKVECVWCGVCVFVCEWESGLRIIISIICHCWPTNLKLSRRQTEWKEPTQRDGQPVESECIKDREELEMKA
jgi:ferredoxin